MPILTSASLAQLEEEDENLDAIDLDRFGTLSCLLDDDVDMDVDDGDCRDANKDSGSQKHTPKKSVHKRPKKGLDGGSRGGLRAGDSRRAKAGDRAVGIRASGKRGDGAGGSRIRPPLGRHSDGTAILTRSKAKALYGQDS